MKSLRKRKRKWARVKIKQRKKVEFKSWEDNELETLVELKHDLEGVLDRVSKKRRGTICTSDSMKQCQGRLMEANFWLDQEIEYMEKRINILKNTKYGKETEADSTIFGNF